MSLVVPDCSFPIQVKMTSDWHVGSGLKRGEVDSLVQRDSDGLPYVPAKTLTGILRDGCEQVALALDGHDEGGKWHRWIDVLFGDRPALATGEIEAEPRPALLSIRSAYLPGTLRNVLKAKKQLQQAIAFIKPGVAIDVKTGSAKPDCLRFEEVVRMGAVLEAEGSFDFSDFDSLPEGSRKVAYALLVAGAKMVDRLGGKRRRGNGNCEIVVGSNTQNWLQWLKDSHRNVENPCQWKRKALPESSWQNPRADTTWYAVPLTVTTNSPVVLPKRTVGNVVESLDFIPGRYFLRNLHQKLGNRLDVSQAIAEGHIVMTDATLSVGGNAGRPTPFCLFGEKIGGGLRNGRGVRNRFQEPENNGIQMKGERSGYLGAFDGSHLPECRTVSLELFTHNTIQDEVQRPTSDVGGVYSYQAIPSGTTLKAELRLPGSLKQHLDSASPDWWQELEGKVRIGQSKKDQYGVVEIAPQQPESIERPETVRGLLYVWFLSDVLLRDKRLNPTTNPDDFRRALEEALDLAKGTLAERQEENRLSLMVRWRRTDSWQVRWGLPRPSMLGWQAGSCAVYRVKGEIAAEKLGELEARGIGDRCAEGYGQICFNDPLIMASLEGKTRPNASPSSSQLSTPFTPIASGDPSFDYARTIEKAAWREAIANRAFAIAADPQKREEVLGLAITLNDSQDGGDRATSQPSMSQLGGLRSVFLELQSRQDVSKVTSWLDALEGVSNRKDKWKDTKDGLTKVRALVTEPANVWQHLDLDLENLVITSNGTAHWKDALWAEAVRTLVNTTIRAHKRALEAAQEKTTTQAQVGEAE